MRISKVYTRTGDGGKTRLAGGQEVWKDSLRVDAYGTVDELNSVIGIVRMSMKKAEHAQSSTGLDDVLKWIQHKLFDLGGILATAPGNTFPNMPVIADTDVVYLEEKIDECQKDLAPLKEFILPGGGEAASVCHLARSVCRRAERSLVTASRDVDVHPRLLAYINRLSDLLFVLTRFITREQGEAEVYWRSSRIRGE